MWPREERATINIGTTNNQNEPFISITSSHTFTISLIQSRRRSRRGTGCIGERGATSRTRSSTHRKFGFCNRGTTIGNRCCRLNDTHRPNAVGSVKCACWIVSGSRNGIRATILRCSWCRGINRKDNNRTTWIGSSVWIGSWLDHDRIFLLSNGFGRARGAGTRTCCASLCAAVGCWDGGCGRYSAGWLDAV
jgi:hypothetical protein